MRSGWLARSALIAGVAVGAACSAVLTSVQPASASTAAASDFLSVSGFEPMSSPGQASGISVYGTNVWTTGATPLANGYPVTDFLDGVTLPGGAVRIADSPGNDPWVVDSQHQIFKWNGSAWVEYPGSATDIGVGANGAVWVVGTNSTIGGYGIYELVGSSWVALAGGAVRVAVDSSGDPWVVNSGQQIFHWNGSNWVLYPGSATDIGAGGGTVWLLGTNPTVGGYGIYELDGSVWSPGPGGATAISVGSSGLPWVVNSQGTVYEGETAGSTAVLWGVDAVSSFTPTFLNNVTSGLGVPQFIGRYLILNPSIAPSLNAEEATYIRSTGAAILLFDDPGTTNLTSAAQASSEASQAIAQAQALGVSRGVAIFRDVEASDTVSSAYLTTYMATIEMARYTPGFYMDPVDSNFDTAYCAAVATNPILALSAPLFVNEPNWTAYAWTRAGMPAWTPGYPPCASLTVAWQYRINNSTYLVDADDFLSQYSALLWH